MSTKEIYPGLHEIGERLIAFGKALQDKDTPLTRIAELAANCGLSFQIRIAPDKQESPEAE